MIFATIRRNGRVLPLRDVAKNITPQCRVLRPNSGCSERQGDVAFWPLATRRLRMAERRFRRKAEMALSSLPCAASRRLGECSPYSRSAISFARKMSCKSKKTLAIHADSRGRRIHGLPRFLSPFLIIDLAKISTSPICSLSAVAGPTNPHTRFVPGGSAFRAKWPGTNGEAPASVGVSFFRAMTEPIR
jgi:hypothetical protein